jgi:hypothetical protein
MTILYFPHRARAAGMPTTLQQHRSVPSAIAKWLIFKTRKLTDDHWQVRARLGPRDESHYVTRFKSERHALEWIAGDQPAKWLKERAAKCSYSELDAAGMRERG